MTSLTLQINDLSNKKETRIKFWKSQVHARGTKVLDAGCGVARGVWSCASLQGEAKSSDPGVRKFGFYTSVVLPFGWLQS